MIKKTYSSTGNVCRVTFRVPADVHAETAHVCGEFNEWDRTGHPMKRRKDGSFSVTLSLKPTHSYRFRYVVDGDRWMNEPDADGYVRNPFGSRDSVLEV